MGIKKVLDNQSLNANSWLFTLLALYELVYTRLSHMTSSGWTNSMCSTFRAKHRCNIGFSGFRTFTNKWQEDLSLYCLKGHKVIC